MLLKRIETISDGRVISNEVLNVPDTSKIAGEFILDVQAITYERTDVTIRWERV